MDDVSHYRYNVIVSAISLIVVICLVNGVFFYWCWYYPRETKRQIHNTYYQGSTNDNTYESSDLSPGIFADEDEMDESEGTEEEPVELTETEPEPEPESVPFA